MSGTWRTFARAARDDAAVALVEFALVMPVLLVLLIGALDFGRAVNAYVTVNAAAREGARHAALDPSVTIDRIATAVRDRSAPLDARSCVAISTMAAECGPLAVSASYYDVLNALQPWPPPRRDPPAPVRMRVEVSYPWSSVTWMAGRFFEGGTGMRTFIASSTMEGRR